MTKQELRDIFLDLESRIANERGGFSLFALFMRDDVPNRWDLMVSAPWVSQEKSGVIEYFVNQIKSQLGSQQLTALARIVVIDPHDPAVQSLNRTFDVEHGKVEVLDSNFFGLPVKHAFIITSKRRPPQAEERTVDRSSR